MLSLDQSERVLAALGEASRLRLLVACVTSERAVGELAMVLGQSEPRVSRHLKILAESGLVERRRDGHRVRYRAARRGDAADLLRTVLARLDLGDATLRRDAGRLERHAARAADACLPTESRLGRAMREFVAAATVTGRTLLLGLRHFELIEAVAGVARDATVVVATPLALETTRAWLERQPVASACEVRVTQPDRGALWQGVILDRAAVETTALEPALLEARSLLAPGGRLWLFERYEALESDAAAPGSHPLARLRQLLAASGFRCERLQPLETDGVHLLAALARAPETWPAAPRGIFHPMSPN